MTRAMEWPTLAMLAATYAAFGITTALFGPHPVLAILLTGIALAQFSSLQHEVLHGHPFARQWLNEALVFPALFIVIPYLRFKDTHLAHHYDPNLTDPYEDPESNYLDPALWSRLPRLVQILLRFNNSLAGRMLIGPAIGICVFLRSEARALIAGQGRVWLGWGLNVAGLIPLIWWLDLAGMPPLAYAASAYIGVSLLRIRTYLEHRAHDTARARTVIVEDRGPLALLFLNNNYHAVHHSHPSVPWYDLPALYAAKKPHFLQRNDGYYYRNYAQIFRQYFWRAKDPVAHPVWPVRKSGGDL